VYTLSVNKSQTLLGLLQVQPSYGYDLKQGYDSHFGARKPIAFGQVYSILARMVRDGLIDALGEEAGSGPDRKRYATTERGRSHLRTWMFTPDIPSATLQSDLFAKTVIALLVDENAEDLLNIQRTEHIARMRTLTREKHQASLADILTIDYALFHIEADLRWIEMTSARLTELKKELALR